MPLIARTVTTDTESSLQRRIMLALGRVPGLLVLRNNVGLADHVRPDGEPYRIPYGLGVGSPDLICFHSGRVFGLECKRPGESATTEQRDCHAMWLRGGAVRVYVVHSEGEAWAAWERERVGG